MDDIMRTRHSPDCYLCGATGNSLYEALSDRLFGALGTWNLKKCPNPDCGLVWLDPMPLEEDIGKAYETYYTHSSPYRPPRFLYRLITAIFDRITGLRQVSRDISFMTLGHTVPGALLDVGCGAGVFCQRMQDLGWQVTGVDFDAEAVDTARKSGLDVRYGNLQSADFPDNSFNAITLNHVIEHVYDPIPLLRECYRILKPNGRLVVVTPNSLSRGHQKFGSYWRDLDPPRHIHLFSPRTLRHCAEKSGYSKITTWSTPANTLVIWSSSLDLQRTGRHDVLDNNPPFSIFLQSYLAQYREYFGLRRYFNGGEEAVLTAVKA